MVQKYVGIDPARALPMGLSGRTGDGIKMGLSAGASTVGMGTLMCASGGMNGIPFGSDLTNGVTSQPTIVLVNEKAHASSMRRWPAGISYISATPARRRNESSVS
jgi:hypothetical protein